MRVSSYPALAGLRLGCIQYLNARPLIHAYGGAVRFDHPANLAVDLAAGSLDVALVPTFEALAGKDYLAADGVSISSCGPVYSVFIAFAGRLPHVQKVILDPASLTSAHLVQCLLSEFHGLHPTYTTTQGAAGAGVAQLLIGNQAIEFRQQHGNAFTYLDLAAEWTRCTSLPFVFALWLIRRGVADAGSIAESLRQLKEEGTVRIEEIVRSEKGRDPDFCRRYLTEHIQYGLGQGEKSGLALFRRIAQKHHLLPPSSVALEYV